MDIKFNSEMIVFIVYLAFMLGIGVFFFIKQKRGSEKTYFLGDRQMGAWVTALSAGASDMSAWVLMGLPAAIYAAGMGEVWCPVGLAIGYALSWIIEAPRLRRFSIVANDSITIPQYLTNRFLSRSKALQIICAVVFFIAYTVYAASSIKACGTLFNQVLGVDATVAMCIGALIIVGYTFLGGFSAVCWTDFFQGMLILAAMLAAPIFALGAMHATDFGLAMRRATADVPGFWALFADWKTVASGLAWGLGYFGMPHIIIRFMSLRSQRELKKSAKIGITWTVLIVFFAAVIGIVGRVFLGFDETVAANETVFIEMVRKLFESLPILIGILLAAVLAASMSTADSQLLAASSSFTSDVYRPVIRKNKASEKEMLWMGRLVVLVIAGFALLLAFWASKAGADSGAGVIMSLVSKAWGLFGAAFGPVILLSLYWKRFNFSGAIAGILAGAAVDVGWIFLGADTGIYELLPGFFCGLIVAVAVTLLTKAPGADVKELFAKAVAYADAEEEADEDEDEEVLVEAE